MGSVVGGTETTDESDNDKEESELMSLSWLGVEEDSRMRKNQIMKLCANEIYNEVSNYALWQVDQREFDFMHAKWIELVRIEKERRDRRNAPH